MTTFTASTNDALRDRISDNLKQLFNCDAVEALKTCRAKRNENGKPCSRKSSSAYNGFCWQHFHRNKLFLLYGDGQLEKLESEELAVVDDLLKSMVSNNKLAPTGPLAFPISRPSKDEWLDLMSRLLGWWFYDRDETFRQDFSSRALGIASLIVRHKCKKLKLMSGHPRILILVLWHLRLLHRPSFEDLQVELLDIDESVIQFHNSLFSRTSWVSVKNLDVFKLKYEADCVVYLNFCGLTANGQQNNPVEDICQLVQALNPQNATDSAVNECNSALHERDEYTPIMLSFSTARGAVKKNYEDKIKEELRDSFIIRKVPTGRKDFVSYIIQRCSDTEKKALNALQRKLRAPRIFPSADQVELCVLFSADYMRKFLAKRGHKVPKAASKDKLIAQMMKLTTKSDVPAIPLLTIEAYDQLCEILLSQEEESSHGNDEDEDSSHGNDEDEESSHGNDEDEEAHEERQDGSITVVSHAEDTTPHTPPHQPMANDASPTRSNSSILRTNDRHLEEPTPHRFPRTPRRHGSEGKPNRKVARDLFNAKNQHTEPRGCIIL